LYKLNTFATVLLFSPQATEDRGQKSDDRLQKFRSAEARKHRSAEVEFMYLFEFL